MPAIIFANILIPGQELAVHTDVPEFRGANRKVTPQWLLVTMLHSGLFDEWRIPITTCVSWFGKSKGGAFAFYPEGPDGKAEAIQSNHNSAIVIDTDEVFHGVERVYETKPDLPPSTTRPRACIFWATTNGNCATAIRCWRIMTGRNCAIRFRGKAIASKMRRKKNFGAAAVTIYPSPLSSTAWKMICAPKAC